MSNGTILEPYAPEAIPAYGFNEGGIVFGFRVENIEAALEELAEAGCELLGQITGIEQMNYAYRDFKAQTDASTGSTSRRSSLWGRWSSTVGARRSLCGLELPSCGVPELGYAELRFNGVLRSCAYSAELVGGPRRAAPLPCLLSRPAAGFPG